MQITRRSLLSCRALMISVYAVVGSAAASVQPAAAAHTGGTLPAAAGRTSNSGTMLLLGPHGFISIDDKSTSKESSNYSVNRRCLSKVDSNSGNACKPGAEAFLSKSNFTGMINARTLSASNRTLLADAAMPVLQSIQSGQSGKKKKSGKFMYALKANISETFQWDPRGVEDFKKQVKNIPIGPIMLTQDNYANGWTPLFQWTQGLRGQPIVPSHNLRTMFLYLAGPITRHLSTWIQMQPQQNPAHHFFDYWELFQGLANYGNENNLVQLKFGQSFNWQNSGWGGADRIITSTSPLIYTAFNGWAPGNAAKTISLDVTGLNWTSTRVFGYRQQSIFQPSSLDPNISFHPSYGVGWAFEKLFGRYGISGIQSNLTVGNTPNYNANVYATQSSPFIWWTGWLNKSFLDSKKRVRFNPSFGTTVFQVKRYLDDPSVSEDHSTGWGYTLDLVTVPIVSYWSVILRLDQLRVNNLTGGNTVVAFTVGQAFDIHGPNKSRIRVSCDYQILRNHNADQFFPHQQISFSLWPIW